MSEPVFRIVPSIQKYDWGKIGAASKVAQLVAGGAAIPADDDTPYAEVRGHPPRRRADPP